MNKVMNETNWVLETKSKHTPKLLKCFFTECTVIWVVTTVSRYKIYLIYHGTLKMLNSKTSQSSKTKSGQIIANISYLIQFFE